MKYLLLTVLAAFTVNAQSDGESEVLIHQTGLPEIQMWCYILDVRVADGLGESFYRISCPDFYDTVPDIDIGTGSMVLVNKGWSREFTVRCPSYFQMDRPVINAEPQFEMVFDCRQPLLIFRSSFK